MSDNYNEVHVLADEHNDTVEIHPEYVYLTIPADYVCVYHKLLTYMADFGKTIVDDCNAICQGNSKNIITCWNLFQSAIACRTLGREKEAAFFIDYIKKQLNNIYKGTDNLYRMCVWDFNNACNNYFEEELPYTGFFLNNRLWFEMLIKDEDFTERIIQRYHSLRKGLLSEEALYRYIDETLDFIAPALKRNDARWGSVEQQAKGLLVPVSRNLDSRSAAEGQLKGYLRNRGKWLDENIETLRQYSASSRVKQYNEVND